MRVHSVRHSWIQGSHGIIRTWPVCPTLLSPVLAPLTGRLLDSVAQWLAASGSVLMFYSFSASSSQQVPPKPPDCSS